MQVNSGMSQPLILPERNNISRTLFQANSEKAVNETTAVSSVDASFLKSRMMNLKFAGFGSKPPSQDVVDARIKKMREKLSELQLDAYLVTNQDEYLNGELPPPQNERLQAMTGFSGEMGRALIVPNGRNLMLVDSRFHISAEEEMSPKLFELGKMKSWGEYFTRVNQFLKKRALESGQKEIKVGFNPFTMSAREFNRLVEGFKDETGVNVELVPVESDLTDTVWENRPQAKTTPIKMLPDSVTGESVENKLQRIRSKMGTSGNVMPVMDLNQIAWLFNLRADDIPYNMVFLSQAILTQTKALLFVDGNRISPEVRDRLGKAGVEIHSPQTFQEKLLENSKDKMVVVDPGSITYGIRKLIAESAAAVNEEKVIDPMKSVKNATEIEGAKRAHLHASVALIKTYKWLDDKMKAGEPVYEADFSRKLEENYGYPLSFPIMAVSGEKSALPHFIGARKDKLIEKGKPFLVDSGIHYLSLVPGEEYAFSTDATQTIFPDSDKVPPTDAEKEKYTNVLKAHIAVSKAEFPEGTPANEHDKLSKQIATHYDHALGHGIPSLTNIHEYPSLGQEEPLDANIAVSIEPGHYEEGWGGIRLEKDNLIENTGKKNNDGKSLFRFNTLDFVPFDNNAINFDMLRENGHLNWLQNHYAKIQEVLCSPSSSYLTEDEKAFLKKKTTIPA